MGGLKLAGALSALVALGLLLAWGTAHPPPRPFRSAVLGAFGIDRPLIRIGVGADADQNAPERIWPVIARTDPDLFLLAGNAVAGVTAGPRESLGALREAYGRMSHVNAFRRFRRAVPMLAIWGEQDYGRVHGDRDFEAKAAAKAMFVDFWGIGPDAPRAKRPGLFDARILGPPGRRVQIILLDLRWFRDPWKTVQEDGRPRVVPDPEPARTLLGAAQWDWLAGELKRDAELRLLVTPLQVVAGEEGAESWQDFPAEQKRLFDLIARTRAGGVIFVSGNRGAGALYRRAAGAPYPLFEITAGPLNAAPPPREVPERDRLGPLILQPNFGLISIDWALRTVKLELKDGEGQSLMIASAPLAALAPPPPGTSFVREEGP